MKQLREREDGFPRWEISLPSAAADAASTSSDNCGDAEFVTTVVESALRIDGSSSPSSSSYVTVSSSDYVLAYHMPYGEDCGEAANDCAYRLADRRSSVGELGASRVDYVGAEFQNNWPPQSESGTGSNSTIMDGSPLTVVRELVVKFGPKEDAMAESRVTNNKHRLLRPRENSCHAGDAENSNRSFPTWRESPPSAARRRREDVFVNNSSSNYAAAYPAPAWEADANKEPQPADREADHRERPCCLAERSPLRWLALIIYYLVLWAVTAAFTYGLLEICMVLSSRGKFPYYIAGHSFFLMSPRLAFAGGNPEPGKVTEFANLTTLQTKLVAELRRIGADSGGRELRSCDSPADATTDEAALMRPCNMTLFVAKATEKVAALLKDRPAALVQIRRHLGYLPAKELTITCRCTASGSDLALTYHSWNGTSWAESSSSGQVMSAYFPMLTRQHSAPFVIVAVSASVAGKDWVDKKLSLRCRAKDGGPGERPERELILRVVVASG